MKTITKTATATTEKGTVLNLTVTAERGWEKVKETLFSDGWNTEIEKMKEFNETKITIVANGQKFEGEFNTGMFVPAEYRKQGVFATFARLGISERVYNELNTAVIEAKKEAETDETWIALQVKKAQSRKEEEEYYAHTKAVENMMTLNGRTY